MNYLKILVEDIHSVVLGTLDRNDKVATRVIDLMYEDGKTVYFLTANTKLMYKQLLENPFVSVTGLTVGSDTMKRKSITLQGKVQCIGKTNLDILLKKILIC
ncbi:pyridoxamine 5'-phosphate oxidase family protein [Gemella cuniculi]|uniref:pyridoxamine 5'-phosphate oxidase family protein n=1 Tax=Gemella cuniculi TaxID=150240 RepID=UPI0003FE10AC|nr:pyridoxamine 5'-phosphate oxidase family protein [Gemella cuniculi]